MLERLVDPAVPGHRAPADRRHRPGRADPAGAGPDRAHPPQGRRRQHGRARSRPGADLHRGRRRGHVPAAGHRRRRRRRRSSSTCESNGYDGWYTLEQDTILDGRAHAARARSRDVRTSADNLRSRPAEHTGDRPAPWNRCASAILGAARIAELAIVEPAARHRAPGWSPSRPATGAAPRRSPPSTASSGSTTPTPT